MGLGTILVFSDPRLDFLFGSAYPNRGLGLGFRGLGFLGFKV